MKGRSLLCTAVASCSELVVPALSFYCNHSSHPARVRPATADHITDQSHHTYRCCLREEDLPFVDTRNIRYRRLTESSDIRLKMGNVWCNSSAKFHRNQVQQMLPAVAKYCAPYTFLMLRWTCNFSIPKRRANSWQGQQWEKASVTSIGWSWNTIHIPSNAVANCCRIRLLPQTLPTKAFQRGLSLTRRGLKDDTLKQFPLGRILILVWRAWNILKTIRAPRCWQCSTVPLSINP